jgi:type I restriction enzyme S subunit
VFHLLHDAQLGSLADSFTGTTIGHLPREVFIEHPMRVPPSREQQSIVETLESLFSRLDDAIASLERVQRNLKRYRAAVLQAAVEGRLVPTEAELARAEGRSFEPASELLARILTERRRRWEESELARLRAKGKEPKNEAWKAKYVEPQPLGMEDGHPLPHGWCWASIDQVGEVVTGTTPATSRPEFYGGTIPFLKPTDLDAGYWSSDAREFLSTLGAENARPVPALSVLVTCIGATIGKVGLARAECATNQQINALVPEGPIKATRFMYLYMVSPIGKREVVGNASATTLPILNKTKFERLPVRLPPLPEQERIVAEVERLFSVTDEVEREVKQNLTRCRRLRQSILKWAFEGKLVDQDPRDEPASVLLERIRAERARAPARPARGRRTQATRGPALPGGGG